MIERPSEVAAVEALHALRAGGLYAHTRAVEGAQPGEWHHTCPSCGGDLTIAVNGASEAALRCKADPACDPDTIRAMLTAAPAAGDSGHAAAVAHDLQALARINAGEHDLGNARRFLVGAGDQVRYSPGLGWLVWDGPRWQPDDIGMAERLVKAELELIPEEAKAILSDGGENADKRAKSRFSWAVKSLQRPKIEAALRLAQTEPDVPVRATELDADPLALNCANGTIDLDGGELRAHERDDLLTKVAPADYRPDATSKRWAEFLKHATAGDDQLELYLQACAGYSLTGLTAEEAMFLVLGPGATGKTTFTEALKATLGDYAATAAFHTFLVKREAGPSSDLARLVGRRLVTSSEVGRDARFNPETIKQLTGGDTVTACHKYRDPFEFRPQFKLWLAANHLPAVDHDDDAMWRRLRVVPFDAVVPLERRDPELKRALVADPNERAAILAWAVEGCFAWQASGFSSVPERVEGATAGYRAENDLLADWLADCCTRDPAARTTRKFARSSYERHCKAQGVEPLDARRFAELLRSHGITDGRANGARVWKGFELRSGSHGTHRGTGLTESPHVRTHGESVSTRPLSDPSDPEGGGAP